MKKIFIMQAKYNGKVKLVFNRIFLRNKEIIKAEKPSHTARTLYDICPEIVVNI